MHANIPPPLLCVFSLLLLLSTPVCQAANNPSCADNIPFSHVQHPYQPQDLWGYVGSPYPTSAHWTNFILNNGTQPAFPLPYYVYRNDSGVFILYSEPTCEYTSCVTSLNKDLFLSSVEALPLSASYLAYHDSLSVTIEVKPLRIQPSLKVFQKISTAICNNVKQDHNQKLCKDTQTSIDILRSIHKTQYLGDVRRDKTHPPSHTESIYGIKIDAMTVHLVYGSPYITVKYGSLTPVISGSSNIVRIDGEKPALTKTYKGSKFTLLLANRKKYVVYAVNGNISFKWNGASLIATTTYHGVLRIAICNNDDHALLLDKYVTPYAIGGTVNVSFPNSYNAEIRFNWIHEGSNADNDLLMLALSHHRSSMRLRNTAFITTPINTIKGKMYGLVKNQWILYETIGNIPEFHNLGVPLNSTEVAAITLALKEDLQHEPATPSTVYEFGNFAARYARLALIAEDVNDIDSKNIALQRLETALNPWLESTNDNQILYDETWKGVVTLRSISGDKNAEYGNGYYNDHHYHWGYLIYASAVLAKLKNEWTSPHAAAVDALVRDIATDTELDPCFPFTRHKDWFLGHSWASGLFEFYDGKNQESTSEAVNAYYAVSLWGLVTNNASLVNWGRLLTSTEIRSAQTYWQMSTNDDIYPSIFSNNQCVGVLWCSKVDYATWFGANTEYIHEIQMLPFTPVSKVLIPYNWIASEYPVLKLSLKRPSPPIEEAWKGYVFITQSFINKGSAWQNALELKSFHMGNSKANTLYMIASN
ncbi:uncharacterized protein LOC126316737 [Schistocerca gregaria]|uniref:uncharacterized protein LOC126316737 n=1 Tax=Schistocerca gregaria TaxID=7010 RepID=UPI00211F3A77|nr:uncharacterized protein LOC126316737 [Schistocerca gregaria]